MRKKYVPKSHVDQVRAACAARRTQKREVDHWLDESRQMLKTLRELERR